MKGEWYALPRRFLLARLQGVAVRDRGACREVCRRRVCRLRFRFGLRRLRRQHLHRHARKRPQIAPDDPARRPAEPLRRRSGDRLLLAAAPRRGGGDPGCILRHGKRAQDAPARRGARPARPPESGSEDRGKRPCGRALRGGVGHARAAHPGVCQDRGRMQLPLRLLRHPARARTRPLKKTGGRDRRGIPPRRKRHPRDRPDRDRDGGVRDRPRRLSAGRPDLRPRGKDRRRAHPPEFAFPRDDDPRDGCAASCSRRCAGRTGRKPCAPPSPLSATRSPA